MRKFLADHRKPNGAHQFEGIALGDDAGAHAVIESNVAVLQKILKMDVGGQGSEAVGDTG